MQDKKYFIVCNPTQEPNGEKMRYCTLKEQLKNLCAAFETEEEAKKHLLKKSYSDIQADRLLHTVKNATFQAWFNI